MIGEHPWPHGVSRGRSGIRYLTFGTRGRDVQSKWNDKLPASAPDPTLACRFTRRSRLRDATPDAACYRRSMPPEMSQRYRVRAPASLAYG